MAKLKRSETTSPAAAVMIDARSVPTVVVVEGETVVMLALYESDVVKATGKAAGREGLDEGITAEE